MTDNVIDQAIRDIAEGKTPQDPNFKKDKKEFKSYLGKLRKDVKGDKDEKKQGTGKKDPIEINPRLKEEEEITEQKIFKTQGPGLMGAKEVKELPKDAEKVKGISGLYISNNDNCYYHVLGKKLGEAEEVAEIFGSALTLARHHKKHERHVISAVVSGKDGAKQRKTMSVLAISPNHAQTIAHRHFYMKAMRVHSVEYRGLHKSGEMHEAHVYSRAWVSPTGRRTNAIFAQHQDGVHRVSGGHGDWDSQVKLKKFAEKHGLKKKDSTGHSYHNPDIKEETALHDIQGDMLGKVGDTMGKKRSTGVLRALERYYEKALLRKKQKAAFESVTEAAKTKGAEPTFKSHGPLVTVKDPLGRMVGHMYAKSAHRIHTANGRGKKPTKYADAEKELLGKGRHKLQDGHTLHWSKWNEDQKDSPAPTHSVREDLNQDE